VEKKNFVLRLDEQQYEAIARWAADDFRSINGQIEWLLHNALKQANRLPEKKAPEKKKTNNEEKKK
jgi:hypothetical protein